MKARIFTLCFLILSFSFSSCDQEKAESKVMYEEPLEDGEAEATPQETAAKVTGTTEISFEKNEHDFGSIEEGNMVSHTFTFKNTGKSPLIISDARASCGCTVPSWTKEPVLPGQEGKIDVKYNGSGKGDISKTVTVIANTEPAENILTIKAKVKSSGSPVKQ